MLVPIDISGPFDSWLGFKQVCTELEGLAQGMDLFTFVSMSNLSVSAFHHLYRSSEAVFLPCLSWLLSHVATICSAASAQVVTAHNNSCLRAHGDLSTAEQPLSWSPGVGTKGEMGAHYAEISVFLLLCLFPFSSSIVYCYSPLSRSQVQS